MPAYPKHPTGSGPVPMPGNRARVLDGQTQYVIFRATGGECAWVDAFEARRVIAERPAEWSPHPWDGQTYGAPRDVHAVEAARNAERGYFPVEWWS